MTEISIIVPTLNEAAEIGPCLDHLAPWRERGHQVIVVDGGSMDGTAALAAGCCDVVARAPTGRSRQMNAGATLARGRLLVFLHADTRLPASAEPVLAAFARAGRACWGRFDVVLNGRHPIFRVVEAMMNWRSRRTGIATGDQAIFVTSKLFHEAGGYRDIDLMEDIELSARLRTYVRPVCLELPVLTSTRRWRAAGVVKTVVKMWCLRLAYFCGVSPARLKRLYDSP